MNKRQLGEFIEELTDFTANGSFADLKTNVKYYNEPNYAVLVRTTDLGKVEFSPQVFTDEHGYEFLEKSKLFGGEIIVANVGSVGKVFRVPKYNQKMTLAPNAYLVKFQKNKIDENYIFQFLISEFFKHELSKKIASTTLQALNKDNFKSISFHYPEDLKEQCYISNILSSADSVIEKTQISIAKYKAIKQGMLDDIFTRGIDDYWTTKKLHIVADIIDPHPSHRAPPIDDRGIPFIGIGDIDVEGNLIKNARKVNESIYDEHQLRYKLTDKTIGFGRVATIGKIIRFRNYNFKMTVSPTMAIIQPKLINSNYLAYALDSAGVKEQIDKLLTGSTRSSLGIELLRDLNIRIPSRKEDELKIANSLKAVTSKLQSEQNYLQKLQSIKQGLMGDLLSGRKRVKVNEQKLTQS